MFQTERELQAWVNAVSILRYHVDPMAFGRRPSHVYSYELPQDHGIAPFSVQDMVMLRFRSEKARDPHTRGVLFDSRGEYYTGPDSSINHWIDGRVLSRGLDRVRVEWDTLLHEPGLLGVCYDTRRVFSLYGDLAQHGPRTRPALLKLWARPDRVPLTLPIARVLGEEVHAQAVLDACTM